MQYERGLIEVKFAPSDDAAAMSFSGYGAAFNNIDAYGDMIEPGAFASYLADVKSGVKKLPKMLAQHGAMGLTVDDMMPIGIWTDLSEDGKGLRVSGTFADTPRGIETYKLMKLGAIDGLSIGYIAKEWTPRSAPDEPRRRLKRIDLIEISPVTFPANGKALVESVKSGLGIRDAERALRDAGFSRTEAKAILAEGFTAVPPRDAEDYSELAAKLRGNIAILTS